MVGQVNDQNLKSLIFALHKHQSSIFSFLFYQKWKRNLIENYHDVTDILNSAFKCLENSLKHNSKVIYFLYYLRLNNSNKYVPIKQAS